ncbi:MAG: DUF4124 domain-containing protein, partial [Halobacteria archaeon]|nr:DUF4124 domain-containing protein [Halobacteria archaeon]
MRSLLILVGLALCVSVLAQDRVYKRVNPDGSVEYSDQPIQGAEVMKVPKGSTFTMPETPTSTAAPAETTPEETSVTYDSLLITRPTNDEAIRSNEGKVTALARVNPELALGHRFRWSMDGEIIQDVNSPELRLNNIDRGSHTLQAEIVDTDGKVIISSETITFHLMRYRIPGAP